MCEKIQVKVNIMSLEPSEIKSFFSVTDSINLVFLQFWLVI
jgi:hypothetical protein